VSRVIAALFVLALGLAGTIGWELREIRRPPPSVVRSAVGTTMTVAAQPATVDHTEEWAETVLARPLFSPNRRPPATTPGAAPGPVALPRLAGVMVGPFGKLAIFAGTADGKPTVASEGSSLGNYVVEAIEVGQVTVQGPGGRRLLHPAFDSSAPPPATAGQPPGPPRAAAAGVPAIPGMPPPFTQTNFSPEVGK